MNIHQQLPSKIRVAESFAKAASSYDRYAHFQRDVADRLLSGIQGEGVKQILDIGSGTGYCASRLLHQCHDANITSLDIAKPMLGHARQAGTVQRESWVCGDGEELPFIDECFDLVVSSLAMQWCPDPEEFCNEVLRVLEPGGRACISTLAEHTLAELRESWSTIDSYAHVNDFLPCKDIEAVITSVPFSRYEFKNIQERHFYHSFSELCRELKGIGAHNLNTGQAEGLTGKNKFRLVKNVFESNAEEGKGIPVTWDLVLIVLEK